jgi:hypothetical protein
MESFRPERCFDWLRDERHVSPMMSAAATLNKKPSARKFAPFSMALKQADQSEEFLDQGGAHLVSERGRKCFAGSPKRPVRSLTS